MGYRAMSGRKTGRSFRAAFCRTGPVAGLAICLALLSACSDEAPEQEEAVNATEQMLRADIDIIGDIGKWGSGGQPDPALNPFSRNLVVLFDGSGSMNEPSCGTGDQSRLAVARNVVSRFIEELPGEFNLGMVAFAGNKIHVYPIGEQRQHISTFLQELKASESTPLGQSLKQAVAQLEKRAALQNGLGDYTILAITDGEASDQDHVTQAFLRMRSTPVHLVTVGFCTDSTHALNLPELAEFRTASDANSLMTGLREATAEAPDFTSNDFTASPGE